MHVMNRLGRRLSLEGDAGPEMEIFGAEVTSNGNPSTPEVISSFHDFFKPRLTRSDSFLSFFSLTAISTRIFNSSTR